MLIDTHCHINSIVKKQFDIPLTQKEIDSACTIIDQAHAAHVTTIINVGTSLVESLNCIAVAKKYPSVFATVGIHPNDCTADWRKDLQELEKLLKNAGQHKIVGIGECGMDKHYPDYNLQRQYDAFRAQIDLALEYDLALVVHTRDAADETLSVLTAYKNENLRGVIHCFSEQRYFADTVIAQNFVLGIGGPLTYPKNQYLRDIFSAIDVNNIVLETDAPFLPPQHIRGKQNSPAEIATIAQFLAQLRSTSLEEIAKSTTATARKLFRIKS